MPSSPSGGIDGAGIVERQLRRGDRVDAGAIHPAQLHRRHPRGGSNPVISRGERRSAAGGVEAASTGAMPLRPSSSASRNAACDVPNAETMPMPDTLTERRTRVRYHRVDEASNARGAAAARARRDRAAALAAAGRDGRHRRGAAADTGARTPRRRLVRRAVRRGQRANAAIKTLTARFTETTTSSLLTRPLVARGRLAVERPSRVVLRYTEPEQRVVLIDGNRMTMSWPSHNVRQTTDIGTAQGRVQKYFVNGTAAELRSQFDIEEHDGSDRPAPIT